MTGKRESKREDLKARLLEAARARIAVHGLAGLKARDITADAGCALGGLYNAYKDLDDLILHVNSRTLADLSETLQTAQDVNPSPGGKLKALAMAYLDFARKNPAHWAALFDHQMPPGSPVPDWHLNEHATLVRHIAIPLSQLYPDFDEVSLSKRARTLFAAVHGIVAISLQDRFIGVDQPDIDIELADFLDTILKGIAAGGGK